jgi:hypothetical protein
MFNFSDPISLIRSGIYIAMLMLVGYTILCVIAGPAVDHWLELLGFSFALGAGSVSMLLFSVSVIGFKPSKFILVGIALIALLILIRQWKSNGLIVATVPAPRGKFDPLTLLGIAGLMVIVASISNVIAFANWQGLNDIDSFATWMFKAKIVTLWPLRPIPLALTVPTLSYSHQDYPLSLPFLVAGLYAAIGHINDQQAKILLLPIYLSLIAIIYSSVRSMHRRATAIAITAIFAAAPTLTANAGLLVAETPLILAWTGAIVMLLRWIENRDRGDLILCGLFSALAAFTKNEGLALLPVMAIIVACMSRKPSAIRNWALAAATILPWVIYRTFLPKTHEDYGGKFTHAATVLNNLNRLGFILPNLFGRLFSGPQMGLIWYVLILTAIMGFRGFRRTSIRVLWILLIAQLSLYTAAFVVTPWNVTVLINMIGFKLLTQSSPIAALLISLHLQEFRWPKRFATSTI